MSVKGGVLRVEEQRGRDECSGALREMCHRLGHRNPKVDCGIGMVNELCFLTQVNGAMAPPIDKNIMWSDEDGKESFQQQVDEARGCEALHRPRRSRRGGVV